MGQRIVIDPVTRIEGHAKISLILDDQGEVSDARFHVVEFRGFEKFCEGRSFREMPGITSRICGICPVSHMLASAKAGDELLAVEIPEARDAACGASSTSAQILQSPRALASSTSPRPTSCSATTPTPRSATSWASSRRTPRSRAAGSGCASSARRSIETLAGKQIHPAWVVPGGVDEPLTAEGRDRIRKWLPEAKETIEKTLDLVEARDGPPPGRGAGLRQLPLALHGPRHARRRRSSTTTASSAFVDATGQVVADQLDTPKYQEYIGEAVEPWTYLKFPYYKPLGYPGGMYRVGPLARLNVASHCGTPLADRELAEFRQLGRGAVLSAVPLPLRAAHRDPLLRRADRGARRRTPRSAPRT